MADYNIRDYGAVGDAVIKDISAIQAAIDACTAAGGGRQDIRPCVGEGLPTYPNSAFYVHNAEGITLRNCQVVWWDNRPDYYHHALEAINVQVSSWRTSMVRRRILSVMRRCGSIRIAKKSRTRSSVKYSLSVHDLLIMHLAEVF